jgi:hypothetical protein
MKKVIIPIAVAVVIIITAVLVTFWLPAFTHLILK